MLEQNTNQITTYSLEMTDPQDLRAPAAPPDALSLQQARIPCPELSRFLYTAVGGDWHWIDRLGWSYDDWMRYLDRPEVETWIGYVEGTPAGYFELEKQPGESVEITYFGLLRGFIGRGLGGLLLMQAVRCAWRMGARRVWVHTCTLDGPAALNNYCARGFRLYKEESTTVTLPSTPPGPWPGAHGD